MKRIAIFYSSKEGQTARIANRMAALLRIESEVRVTVRNLAEIEGDVDLSPYNGVVIGGSVHHGHHAKELVEFAKLNRTELEKLPSAFFSVSLSAAGGPEEQTDAQRIVDEFIGETMWKPGRTEIFAGALLYRRYNFILRWIMKKIAGKAGGDTDTSRNFEYTNWKRVKAFMRGYLKENFA